MPKPRRFCDNQYEAKEDIGTGHYTCLGHLAEGRAFECRYKEYQISLEEDRFRIISELGGRCEDFQILPEVKKDLTEN
jgi:hypothetical protein